MERNYEPDGWLGILLGAKYFHEFTDKYPFEIKIERLLQEILIVLNGGISPEVPKNVNYEIYLQGNSPKYT